jgi:hypothetical protein
MRVLIEKEATFIFASCPTVDSFKDGPEHYNKSLAGGRKHVSTLHVLATRQAEHHENSG